jgi:hypothetical protein
MSSVPRPNEPSAAQRAAQAQALPLLQQLQQHRQAVSTLVTSRAGMCMANGWEVTTEHIDGDFELDAPFIARLLEQGNGPTMRAAPPRAGSATPPAGPSAVERYLFPEPATAPLRSVERFAEEVPGAAYGPGNLAANVAAASAGALQSLGERRGAQAMRDGVIAILERRAQRVTLAPGLELYNSAEPRQRPRVRLRARGLPIATVRAMVPGSGGPVTQWRVNGAGNTASLRVRGMTSQQLRQTAILAGSERLPGSLRWASGPVGGGVLTFGPTAVLDFYSAIEVDLQTGQRSFNHHSFLVNQARNQSGNAVGFGAGMVVTGVALVAGGAAAAASAPVLIIAFGVGLVAQVVWNAAGGADWAEGQARAGLR